MVIERFTYKEEVEIRLSLLQTLVNGGCELNLHRAQIDRLWETLLKKSLCSTEREHYLKRLADATNIQSQRRKGFDAFDIYFFFMDNVARIENWCKYMHLEEFEVFKSYFLLMNVILKKMQQRPKLGLRIPSPLYSLESNVKEIEYKALVPPRDLECMTSLQKIILECESETVVLQASGLLDQISDNVVYSTIDSTAIELREVHSALLELCQKWRGNSEEKGYDNPKEFTRGI